MRSALATMLLLPGLSQAACPLRTLHPTAQGVRLDGGVMAALGDPDHPDHPTAWEGPIVFSGGPGGCTVSDTVAVITTPIVLAGTDILYVSTYSGSTSAVYAVGVHDCSIRWTSPAFEGTPRYTGHTLHIKGHAVTIGADCLPVKRP